VTNSGEPVACLPVSYFANDRARASDEALEHELLAGVCREKFATDLDAAPAVELVRKRKGRVGWSMYCWRCYSYRPIANGRNRPDARSGRGAGLQSRLSIGGPPAGYRLLAHTEEGGDGRFRIASFDRGQGPRAKRFQDEAGQGPRIGMCNKSSAASHFRYHP